MESEKQYASPAGCLDARLMPAQIVQNAVVFVAKLAPSVSICIHHCITAANSRTMLLKHPSSGLHAPHHQHPHRTLAAIPAAVGATHLPRRGALVSPLVQDGGSMDPHPVPSMQRGKVVACRAAAAAAKGPSAAASKSAGPASAFLELGVDPLFMVRCEELQPWASWAAAVMLGGGGSGVYGQQ